MPDFGSLSKQLLTSLELKFSPIAINFGNEPLAEHTPPDKAIAAGCQF